MIEPTHAGEILTEEDWLTSSNPEQMEQFLGEQGSRRRWQLLACVCCWRIMPLLSDERSRNAVSHAERLAEGRVTRAEVADALEEAHTAVLEAWQPGRNPLLAFAAMAACYALSSPRRAYVHAARATGSGEPAERLAQCGLFHELFGNPFRPCLVDPSWRTTEVLAIAGHVYEREAFAEMPVLGDALEDVGCRNEGLLSHCWEGGTHVRGCWVLDLVLSRE